VHSMTREITQARGTARDKVEHRLSVVNNLSATYVRNAAPGIPSLGIASPPLLGGAGAVPFVPRLGRRPFFDRSRPEYPRAGIARLLIRSERSPSTNPAPRWAIA
jgi:hypothetical protein